MTLQLELFADVDEEAPPALASYAIRCAATIDRITAVAKGERPRRPDGGGMADGVRWQTTSTGIEVTSETVQVLYRWRQIDQAIERAITPGICSAIAAWVVRWRAIHDARPYVDLINGHRAYSWPTFLYVTGLADAIESDVRHSATPALEVTA